MALTKSKLKDIKSLLTKKGRKEKKKFCAEGVRLLEEALRHEFLPELVCFAPSLVRERGKNLVREFEKRHIRVEPLKAQELKPLSGTKMPQGLVAVFPLPRRELSELCQPPNRRLLLCDGISDPGNLGTVIRSALAFGFRSIILTGQCCEPYSPKVVRSSAGAVFGARPVVAGARKVLSQVRSEQHVLVAADLAGESLEPHLKVISGGRTLVLVLGSEAEGLSDDVAAACEIRVRINQSSDVESLNVAVAGSILMKQIFDMSR